MEEQFLQLTMQPQLAEVLSIFHFWSYFLENSGAGFVQSPESST